MHYTKCVSYNLGRLPPKLVLLASSQTPGAPVSIETVPIGPTEPAAYAKHAETAVAYIRGTRFNETDEIDKDTAVGLYNAYVQRMSRALPRLVAFIEHVKATPMLLSLIALLVRHRASVGDSASALPTDVFSVYREAFAASASRVGEDAAATLKVLAKLAVSNMRAGRREFTEVEAQKALTERVYGVTAGDESRAELWTRLATIGSVPLVRILARNAAKGGGGQEVRREARREGLYEFAHPTIQEALAADAAVVDGRVWRTDEMARAFVKDQSNESMLCLGGGALGSALATRHRAAWGFAYGGMTDDHVAVVSRLLDGNTALTSLDLSGNELGPKAGRALAMALAGNEALTSLDLKCNALGVEGATEIAKSLHTNSVLASLDVSGMHNSNTAHNVGEAGAVAIAEALRTNKALTSLILNYNGIATDGGRRIARAIEESRSLTNLCLFDNALKAEGGIAFVESINKCGGGLGTRATLQLTHLDVRSNELFDDVKQTLLAAAARLSKHRGTIPFNVRVWRDSDVFG